MRINFLHHENRMSNYSHLLLFDSILDMHISLTNLKNILKK